MNEKFFKPIAMILSTSLILILFSSCGDSKSRSENEIRQEFDDAVADSNYCEIDADCVLVYPQCPLGCGTAVNINEQEKIENIAENLIEEYKSSNPECAYSCLAVEPICVNGTCQVQ